jgi:hypothetical protein
MSRSIMLISMLFALGTALPAAAGSTPTVANCSSLDDSTYDIDANIRMRGDDIVFERGRDETARLTHDYRLIVEGDEVVLDAEGRAAVVGYVDTFDYLIDEATAIGLDGARLGTRAAAGAVRAIFSSANARVEFEDDIESQAAALEARGEALCETVHSLRAYHDALADAAPAFAAAVPLKD